VNGAKGAMESQPRVVIRPEMLFIYCAMRQMLLALLVGAALTACGNVAIGPVDHSCAVNPTRGGDGSGCDRS
jgi:hypothetical protein